MQRTILVTGAAGFIGSHLTDRLLREGHAVIGIDNLSRGSVAHLVQATTCRDFTFVRADLMDIDSLRRIVSGVEIHEVWHMVANSDIPSGVADPNIDLRSTFLTTFNLIAVMREARIRRLAFASTSAVYGMLDKILNEDTGPLFPISNYGAMKLASEALISASVESFLERALLFRFPNVVGSRATHGIIFDLLTKLSRNPEELEVLGDGTQQKPYLHVSELIDAMLLIDQKALQPLNCFNIGPADEGMTVRKIAEAVVRNAAPSATIRFTGGSKGWTGDVPRFRYSIEKIVALGWEPQLGSAQAIYRAISEISQEFQSSAAE